MNHTDLNNRNLRTAEAFSWGQPDDDDFHYEECDGNCNNDCAYSREIDIAEARLDD
jgi:hypothetical protein